MMKGTSHRDGFTLIEVLAALFILTFVFSALHEGMSIAWRGIGATDGEREAIQIAKAKLAEAGRSTPLLPGDRKVVTGGRSVLTRIAVFRPPAPASRAPLQAYLVTVKVS
ncbi:MAG: hypothetical protein RLZ98_2762, partial [Pseudomonadota bacterium]